MLPIRPRWHLPRIAMKTWFIGLMMLTLVSALSPVRAQPEQAGKLRAYVLNSAHSRFAFSIGHFFVSSTEGEFAGFDGRLNFDPATPEQGAIVIHVTPASISTGIAARDEHLRTADFFDVAKFPVITFQSRTLVRNSSTTGTLTGLLTLHGVSRPVSVQVALHTPDLSADRLDFSVTGRLKRSDFGMSSFQGVIGDEVSLDIQAEFDREH
jgi:polyisoprenoid-binding protein YceI